jgi:hypothetical protein
LDGSHGSNDAVIFRSQQRQAECVVNDETAKSELLFYLVTGGMANLVCRSREDEFALEFQKGALVPDEQVLKSPSAARQVPYNQQLAE